MTRVSVSTSGPWFDRTVRDEILNRYKEHTENRIGEVGVAMIQMYLVTRYKHNRPDPHAGLYESGIHTERALANGTEIYDTPVVYGPWLEGIGSRNAPVTRFRGYGAFRRVSQGLNSFAKPIAEEELRPYLEELNA